MTLNRNYLTELPEEIQLFILSYLQPQDLILVGTASKRLYRLASDDSLWKRYFFENFLGVMLNESINFLSYKERLKYYFSPLTLKEIFELTIDDRLLISQIHFDNFNSHPTTYALKRRINDQLSGQINPLYAKHAWQSILKFARKHNQRFLDYIYNETFIPGGLRNREILFKRLKNVIDYHQPINTLNNILDTSGLSLLFEEYEQLINMTLCFIESTQLNALLKSLQSNTLTCICKLMERLLCRSAMLGKVEIVEYLLDRNVSPHTSKNLMIAERIGFQKPEIEINAIGLAAKYGRLNVLKLYLRKNIDLLMPAGVTQWQLNLNSRRPLTINEGCTPLYYAIKYGHINVVRFLLRLPNFLDKEKQLQQLTCGETLLHLAVNANAIGVIQLLLAQGAGVMTGDAQGISPLAQAAYDNKFQICKLFLSATPNDKYLIRESNKILKTLHKQNLQMLALFNLYVSSHITMFLRTTQEKVATKALFNVVFKSAPVDLLDPYQNLLCNGHLQKMIKDLDLPEVANHLKSFQQSTQPRPVFH